MEGCQVNLHNVSSAHNSTSWLDHVICIRGAYSKLNNVTILDMLPSSDHLPVHAIYDFNIVLDFIDNYACAIEINVSFNWSKCTPANLLRY